MSELETRVAVRQWTIGRRYQAIRGSSQLGQVSRHPPRQTAVESPSKGAPPKAISLSGLELFEKKHFRKSMIAQCEARCAFLK